MLARHLVVIVLCIQFITGCGTHREPEKTESDKSGADKTPQAVVLLTIDTLRADRVSFSGYEQPTTPFLDSLAARAVTFRQAYAVSSYTPLSFASLFSSLYPTSHGVKFKPKQGADRSPIMQVLSKDVTTMAEIFKAAGYSTFGVSANPLLIRRYGFAQGFDHYFCAREFIESGAFSKIIRRELKKAFGNDWARAWKKQKTFFWIHYIDPHSPYHPYAEWLTSRDAQLLDDFPRNPAGVDERVLKRWFSTPDPVLASNISKVYDSEINRVDTSIQRLWNELSFDDSVLQVITSDHGEEFGEHGGLGHGRTLYEEVLHVPLVVRWPNRLTVARAVSTPVDLLDVLPTILELCQIGAQKKLWGHSLATILSSGLEPSPRAILAELFYGRGKKWFSYREGPYKYLQIRDEDEKSDHQLYDLVSDPREKTNLAIEQLEHTQKLQSALKDALDKLPAPGKVEEASLGSEEQIEQLKAVGYLAD